MILKIQKAFEDIFLAHPVITESSFVEYKSLNLNDFLFPLAQGVVNPLVKQTSRGMETYTAEFMILDIIQDTSSNENIVLNRTKNVCDDITNFLFDIDRDVFGFSIGNVTKQFIKNPDEHNILGCRTTFDIIVENGYNNCLSNIMTDELIGKGYNL
jgi:hypothetical protein